MVKVEGSRRYQRPSEDLLYVNSSWSVLRISLRVIKKKYRLECRVTKFLSWVSDKYTYISEKHTYHSCIYWPAIYIYCNRLCGLHDFTGFTLSRVTQEYDFSINNAPLIIALLFKGEWQSFPCSRGERGLCLRERPDLHFGKCTLFSGGLPIIFCQYWQWTCFVVENSPVLCTQAALSLPSLFFAAFVLS